MRYLVTGGAGFIGSNLCRRLLSDGHSVACLDDLSTGKYRNIEEIEENKTLITWEASYSPALCTTTLVNATVQSIFNNGLDAFVKEAEKLAEP